MNIGTERVCQQDGNTIPCHNTIMAGVPSADRGDQTENKSWISRYWWVVLIAAAVLIIIVIFLARGYARSSAREAEEAERSEQIVAESLPRSYSSASSEPWFPQ